MRTVFSYTNLTKQTGSLKHASLITLCWDVLLASSLDRAASFSYHQQSLLCPCQESQQELDTLHSMLNFCHTLNKQFSTKHHFGVTLLATTLTLKIWKKQMLLECLLQLCGTQMFSTRKWYSVMQKLSKCLFSTLMVYGIRKPSNIHFCTEINSVCIFII